MKKIFSVIAAAATILAASCSKENLDNSQLGPESEGIIARANLQPVDVSKAVGQYIYDIVWETDDRISVLDKNGVMGSFKLKTGEGTTSGTFIYEGKETFTAPLTGFFVKFVAPLKRDKKSG